MSDLLFDTSAIAKRYLAELGSRWVRETARPQAGRHVWVSRVTPIELASACARQFREGRLTLSERDELLAAIQTDLVNQYRLVDLNQDVVDRATALVQTHPLRAYDAVQLASALVLSEQFVAAGLLPLCFVSADDRLIAAASAEGLAVQNPLAHP